MPNQSPAVCEVESFMTSLCQPDSEQRKAVSKSRRGGKHFRGTKKGHTAAVKDKDECHRGSLQRAAAELSGGFYVALLKATRCAIDSTVPSIYTSLFCTSQAQTEHHRGVVANFWARHSPVVLQSIEAMEQGKIPAFTPAPSDATPSMDVGDSMTSLALVSSAFDMYSFIYSMIPMMAAIIQTPSVSKYAASSGREWLEALAVSAPSVAAHVFPYETLDMIGLQLVTQRYTDFYFARSPAVQSDTSDGGAKATANVYKMIPCHDIAARILCAHFDTYGQVFDGSVATDFSLTTLFDPGELPRITDERRFRRQCAMQLHWIAKWSAKVHGASNKILLLCALAQPELRRMRRVRHYMEGSQLPDHMRPAKLTQHFSRGFTARELRSLDQTLWNDSSMY